MFLSSKIDVGSTKFLVIDDSPTIRFVVTEMLKALGATEIAEAADGSQALAKMAMNRIDVVICDYMMAPMNGVVFTEYVRNFVEPRMRETPIIVMSGKIEESVRRDSLAAGANAFALKPLRLADLRQLLNSVLVDSPA